MPNTLEHELDRRIVILETKDGFIMEALENNKQEHAAIMNTLTLHGKTLHKVDSAVQNLATNTESLADKVNLLTKDYTETKTKHASTSTITKITWGFLSALILTAIGIAIKTISGCGG